MIVQKLITFTIFSLIVLIIIINLSNLSPTYGSQSLLPVNGQSGQILGKITEVNNNHTVGINNTLLVELAFADINITDQTKSQDATHFMSVLCPIRSPVVVVPEIDSTDLASSDNQNKVTKVKGIVFCQSNSISDMKDTKSINEQLIEANLATLDNKSCINSELATSQWFRNLQC